jgi:hypothetical protein
MSRQILASACYVHVCVHFVCKIKFVLCSEIRICLLTLLYISCTWVMILTCWCLKQFYSYTCTSVLRHPQRSCLLYKNKTKQYSKVYIILSREQSKDKYMYVTLNPINNHVVITAKFTLSVNITFICTSFRNRQNSEPLASFSGLFRSEYKWILYLTTMYVYCQIHWNKSDIISNM